jgi:hypothetical protein
MRPPTRNTPTATPQTVSRLSLALLACLAIVIQPLHSQSPNPQEKPMKHYALIFHVSSTRTLTPQQRQQRQAEITAWAQQVAAMGVALDPRALGDTAANLSLEGDRIVDHQESTDPTFRNLVFFDSPSTDQAIQIARLHPGLHYGATVEVREWTDPRQIPAKP